jgi:hypothetical protein
VVEKPGEFREPYSSESWDGNPERSLPTGSVQTEAQFGQERAETEVVLP